MFLSSLVSDTYSGSILAPFWSRFGLIFDTKRLSRLPKGSFWLRFDAIWGVLFLMSFFRGPRESEILQVLLFHGSRPSPGDLS